MTKTYKVLVELELDGVKYDVGDEIDLTAEQATQLGNKVELIESGSEADVAKEITESILKLVKADQTKAFAEMKDGIEKYLKDQKELMAKEAGIYHPEVKEQRKKLNGTFRNYFQAVAREDVESLKSFTGLSQKELTTDSTGTPYGGYVTDNELSAEIRHLITQYGVARREMNAIPLSKHTYTANELASDVVVYWVDEGSGISSSQIVLGRETLSLKKLGAIVSLTRELIADEEIDLFSFIGGRVAEGFAKAEDQAYFIGDGTSTYGGFTGLLEADDVEDVVMTGVTAFTGLTTDHLYALQDASHQSVASTGTFLGHRSIRNIIRNLKDLDGRPIYQMPSETGPATVLGRPYVEVEVMPSRGDSAAGTPFLLYGDLKKACILGYKNEMAADRFTSGMIRNVANTADINLITTDRECIRWITRTGYIRILPGAVVRLTTDTSGS
jgi:HK97 family phage major capsid protein